MTWVAVAIGGAAVIGGATSYLGSQKQSGAANKASQQQLQMFQQTQANLSPYMQTGQQANQELAHGLGLNGAGQYNPNSPLLQPFGLDQFQQSPDYQFNLQQGQQAIDKAASARGNYYAPQTLQDTAKFSQGLASQEFNNAYQMYNQNQGNIFSRLFQTSGSGQNAAAGLGGLSQSAATGSGLFGTSAGAAQAGGIQGAGMSLSQLAYLPLLQQQLGQQQQSTYGGNAPYPTGTANAGWQGTGSTFEQ